MGLLGPENPKRCFWGDRDRISSHESWYAWFAYHDSRPENRPETLWKSYFWILWTSETHFALSNALITHFATIFSQNENSWFFIFFKILKNIGFVTIFAPDRKIANIGSGWFPWVRNVGEGPSRRPEHVCKLPRPFGDVHVAHRDTFWKSLQIPHFHQQMCGDVLRNATFVARPRAKKY